MNRICQIITNERGIVRKKTFLVVMHRLRTNMDERKRSLLNLALDDDAEREEREASEALLRRSAEARETMKQLRSIHRFVSSSARRNFSEGFSDRVVARLAARHEGVGSTNRTQSAEDETTRSANAPPSGPGTIGPARGSRAAGDQASAARVRTQMGPDRPPAARDRMRGAIRRWHWWLALPIAAVIVLVIWMQPVTVTAERGSRLAVVLPDGSAVELNSASFLRYRRGFADRTLQLHGEAFFQVVDDGRDFVVETFNARVTVLGTEFNVRAWPDDVEPATSVSVASGRVMVEGAGAHVDLASVRLAARQSSSVHADSITAARPDSVMLERISMWRTGGLAFVDQPLAVVLPEIARRFDVDLEFSDVSHGLRRLTYLNPNPQSATGVLADVCETVGLRYRRTASGFVLFADT